ncbi:hypothetical protein C4564_01385 [Candidatus Microgenomates bacterium]|nr:MAG: hypothetical protein C4564_01385 [Candidatus Microgenomates bacterium]
MMPAFQDLKEGEYFILCEQLYKKTGPRRHAPVYMQMVSKYGLRIVMGDSEEVKDLQAEVQLFPTPTAAAVP